MKKIVFAFYAALITSSLSIFLTSCDEDFETPPEVEISDDFVDLRPQQTSLKNQGGRTTCIVFAGIAATEAAYKRLGYGELDLSEEFNNFTRKAFYLHPIWSDYEPDSIHKRETQLGHTGGGGGTGVVAILGSGFKVPLEEVMPYQSDPNYYSNNYAALSDISSKITAGTVTQRDYSNFNLDSTILTDEILRTKKFYSVAQYRFLDDATDPVEIEAVLKRGYEVTWDFSGADPGDEGGLDDNGIWQKCDDCDTIAHAMLIVGYDKRDANPDNHYFIVKNSWGDWMAAPDGEGYTYISYDYVRNYGRDANFIQLVNPPTEWPELAFIGRWKLNFDGFKGDLDIYHLPGMGDFTFKYNFGVGTIPQIYDDYRFGTFYDAQGNPFRVNGNVAGNRIEFYIDGAKPLLRWDEISGRKFIYYLDSTNFMAGYHEDGDGAKYGGYATKSDYLPGGTQTPRPFLDGSYLNSNWDFQSVGYTGTLNFNLNLTSEFEDFFLLEGTYTPTGGSSALAQIKIMRDETNKVYLQMANMGDGKAGSFIGRHLSWENGLITGNTPETGTSYPFHMIRK